MTHTELSKRKKQIAQVLARQGFGWLWSKWGIDGVLGSLDHRPAVAPHTEPSQPERLRLTLEELGTTFIKVGQVLSTRQDLIPHEYIVELSKLQDHAPLVPYADIEEAIERELGDKPENLFASFEKEPRAAASIGQVHSATLQDGTRVVVKIRRPGIVEQIDQDLAILGQLARILAQNKDFGKRFDFEGLVQEFGESLKGELDFVHEGQNSERIAKDSVDNPTLHVPAIYWERSTHGVLTMEEVSGIKIDNIDALTEAQIDLPKLAESCARIALEQIFEHGFFHADPHPGNFFVLPDGVVALIDYGMVGRLGDRQREALVRLAFAVTRHDSTQIVDELLSMGAVRGTIDRRKLGLDLDRAMAQFDGQSLGEISAAKIFQDINSIAQRYSLLLPSELVLVFRVLAMDEGMGAKLDPNFKMIEFAQPYFKRFWLESHSLNAIAERIQKGVVEMADTYLELPNRLIRLLGSIERGELQVVSRVEMDSSMAKKAQQMASRIAISILAAGLIVGLSVLAVVYRPAGSDGVFSLLMKALLVVSVGISGWLIAAFWKSSR